MKMLLLFKPEFEKEITFELQNRKLNFKKLSENTILADQTNDHIIWSQQIWRNCQIQKISSIGDAQKELKSLKKFWLATTINNHRRTQLIAEKLPLKKTKEIQFESNTQKSFELGSTFGLIDNETLIYSTEVSNPYLNGEIKFIEDKNAPSRAYLKLWEYFLLYDNPPNSTDRCIDVGSCPGGWTWVLANLNCPVISVDKAPIRDDLLKIKNINYQSKDAFKLNPKDFLNVDWFFSDIICEPERLYSMVLNWIENSNVNSYVCTIKFKGKTDFEILNKFLRIKGSQCFHLWNNKHEVTWSYRKSSVKK